MAPLPANQNIPTQLSPDMLAQLTQMGALPPPKTPASAGFAAWASDPQNTQTVANSLVKPGQPLLPPNAPQAAAQAEGQPTQSPANPAVPPSAPPVVPAAQVAPPVAPPASVSVAGASPFPSYAEWAAANPDKLATPSWQHKAGGGWRGALKDAGGIAVAGLLGAAGGMNHDPGAGVRYAADRAALDRQVPDVNQARYKAGVIDPLQAGLQAQDTQAQIYQRNASAKYTGDRLGVQMQKSGFKPVVDATGNPTGEYAPDFDSPGMKSLLATAAMHNSTAGKNTVEAELAPQKIALRERGLDQGDRRIDEVQIPGLGVRRQSLQLRKNDQEANFYGLGPDGKPLPNAPVFTGENGEETVGGLKGAGLAVKNQQKVVTFNDLQGSVGHARQALSDYISEGGSLADPSIVAAMSDPHSMIGKVVNGQLVQGNLSPKAVSAINSVRQLHEQAGILRQSTGGTGSEAQAQRILDTVPVAGDANNIALDKLGQVDTVLTRLAPAQVHSAGGMKPHAGPYKAGNQSSTSVSYKQTATGAGGHKIGSNDGGNSWYDVQTGKKVQ